MPRGENHAWHRQTLPGVRTNHQRGRPSRRRHRSGGLLRHGELRAPKAARPVADSPRSNPPPHQGRVGRRPQSRDFRIAGGRGLELLAEHPQQCQRNALRRPRRQRREDHRARPAGAGTHRRPRGPRPAEDPWPGERRRVPHPGPVEPEPARRPRQVRAVEPQRQRCAGGGRYGRRRQGVQPDDRGRTELRHHIALSPRAAIEPGRNPRHPGGGEQEHGGQQPVERTGQYAGQWPH